MSGIIPKEKAGSARRWEPPAMGAGAAGPSGAPVARPATDPRAAGQPPTTRQFEAVYAEAETQGHEEGRAAGHAEGLAQGIAEGRAAGLAEGRAQAAAEREALRALLLRMVTPVRELDAQVETSLVALALEVARQVVLHEVKTRPEELVGPLRKALASFPAHGGLPWVRLHPDDAALVEDVAADLKDRGVDLIPDATLERGDVVIAADPGTSGARPERRWRGRGREAATELDLRLEERWRQVMSHLFEEGLQ